MPASDPTRLAAVWAAPTLTETEDARLARLRAGWLLSFESAATRKAYFEDWRSWAQFTGLYDVSPILASRVHCDAFARWLEGQDLAPRTRSRRLSTVSSWMSWLCDQDLRDQNPMVRVRRPRISRQGSTRALTEQQERAVYQAAVAGGPHRELLVLLLLGNGLRASEALGLDSQDVRDDGGHRVATITRKGGTAARHPLPPATARLVDQLAEVQGPGPLLRRQDGQRLDSRTGRRWVTAIGTRAGVPWLHPHACRASFVTHLLNAGEALHLVQHAAGHASVEMTWSYFRSRQNFDQHVAYVMVRDLTAEVA